MLCSICRYRMFINGSLRQEEIIPNTRFDPFFVHSYVIKNGKYKFIDGTRIHLSIYVVIFHRHSSKCIIILEIFSFETRDILHIYVYLVKSLTILFSTKICSYFIS